MSNVSISLNNGGNKLRTYKLFKGIYETEPYVKTISCQGRKEVP